MRAKQGLRELTRAALRSAAVVYTLMFGISEDLSPPINFLFMARVGRNAARIDAETMDRKHIR